MENIQEFGEYMISIHTPLAGSDIASIKQGQTGTISIHTPLAGSDTAIAAEAYDHQQFQSTLPLRGVTL